MYSLPSRFIYEFRRGFRRAIYGPLATTAGYESVLNNWGRIFAGDGGLRVVAVKYFDTPDGGPDNGCEDLLQVEDELDALLGGTGILWNGSLYNSI